MPDPAPVPLIMQAAGGTSRGEMHLLNIANPYTIDRHSSHIPVLCHFV